jgi:hypothetical protein
MPLISHGRPSEQVSAGYLEGPRCTRVGTHGARLAHRLETAAIIVGAALKGRHRAISSGFCNLPFNTIRAVIRCTSLKGNVLRGQSRPVACHALICRVRDGFGWAVGREGALGVGKSAGSSLASTAAQRPSAIRDIGNKISH